MFRTKISLIGTMFQNTGSDLLQHFAIVIHWWIWNASPCSSTTPRAARGRRDADDNSADRRCRLPRRLPPPRPKSTRIWRRTRPAGLARTSAATFRASTAQFSVRRCTCSALGRWLAVTCTSRLPASPAGTVGSSTPCSARSWFTRRDAPTDKNRTVLHRGLEFLFRPQKTVCGRYNENSTPAYFRQNDVYRYTMCFNKKHPLLFNFHISQENYQVCTNISVNVVNWDFTY